MIHDKGWGPKPVDKKKVKMHNGVVIGSKETLTAKEALKAGMVKKLKQPFKTQVAASTPVDRDHKGNRKPGKRPAQECGDCYGTGVASYNALTKRSKDCKKCHGAGYL